MKAGTFDAYPSHSADPYRGGMSAGSRDLGALSHTGKYFIPSPGPKSAPSTSVLDQNVVRFVTAAAAVIMSPPPGEGREAL